MVKRSLRTDSREMLRLVKSQLTAACSKAIQQQQAASQEPGDTFEFKKTGLKDLNQSWCKHCYGR